jgi:hypothetical protein
MLRRSPVLSETIRTAGARAVAWLARDAWLRAVTLGVSLALLAAFLWCRDLPMVDLPQHAAQIATWQRWDAGVPEVVERFELNFRTPYLLAYPLARALAPLVGVVVALKLVVWLSVVLNLWATEALARRRGHDPWIGLFGLVTAMGLCFYFGFISFMLAVPLAVLALALALRHAEKPGVRSGVLLSALLCLLLTAHGVAFVMGFGTVALTLLRGGGRALARWAPLGPPVLLGGLFFAPGPVSMRIGGDAWALSPMRVVELPALLVGMSAADHFALTLGLALLAAAALALGGRTARTTERVLPLVLLLSAYCFFPSMFRGVVLLHTRLPCFLLPVLLLALEPRLIIPPRDRSVARGALASVTLMWLAVFVLRLAAFNREAAAFHRLEARIPPGLAMRALVFERETSAFPAVPVYLHYAAYYYVERGGSQGYSFAMYPLSVVRYRPQVAFGMQGGAEWRPDWFRQSEIGSYDYFLVKSARDRSRELFAGAPVELEAHEGTWWGYARREAPLKASLERAASAGGT